MKRIIALILALVMTMALVACGGDKPTSSTPTTPSNPTEPSKPADPSTPDKPAEPTLTKAEQLKKDNADKYGGELRVVFGGQSPTMDMHSSNAGSLYVNRFGLHIWDSLLTIDANGKTYPNIMSLEESADGCTYTMTLLDRHFSNGKKITMEDIEASLRRFVAMFYTTQSGYDNRFKGTTWKIDGDKLIFQTEQFNINLKSIFQSVSGNFKIMPKEICEKYAPDWSTGTYDPTNDLTWGCTTVKEINVEADCIGSGPYMLESWIGDSEIVLVRNESYELIVEGNEDAIGAAAPRMAYADKIIYCVNTDSASNTAATLAGEYDIGAVRLGLDGACFSCSGMV